MTVLRSAVVLIAGFGGVLLLASFGPLQLPVVVVYTGVAITLAGVLLALWPVRFLISGRRRNGFAVLAAGAVLLGCGFWLPAGTQRSSSGTPLDSFLPEYQFHEFHQIDVHATPDRAMDAVREVTFAELGVMRTLGRIRSIAMGNVRSDAPLPQKPIIGLISSGATAFFPLQDSEREYIFGMAGQPWNRSARPVRLSAASFASWQPPGQVKIASNVRVEDLGGGWSRVSTETRVQATDEAARRTMARYWRLIYPGSGMIRQSMLRAIRDRAIALP